MTEATRGSAEPTVYVIDDDESIRELLMWLMRREKLPVRAFASAHGFLEAWRPDAPGCLVLDLFMPGMSGLDLQQYLNANGVAMPVIFLSGRADVSRAVEAVKGGAIDFVEKPFDYKRIVTLVREGLASDALARAVEGRRRALAERIGALTQREREVMDRVVAGQINRVIAEELDISVKTVEAHRAHIMEKLGVGSVAELVQAVLEARAVRPGGR